MHKLVKTLILTAASLLLIVSMGCRSKTVVEEAPAPTTAPEPAPVVEQPKQVEEPTDFAPEKPVDVEDLSGDIADVNQRAQDRGWVRDAFFELDSFILTSASQDNLAISSAWLKGHSEFNVVLEGHCDERGTDQYNLALGDRRANAAKNYLVTLGIPEGRIRTVSYGEERPFDPGHNDSAWAKNRRAHIVLVRK